MSASSSPGRAGGSRGLQANIAIAAARRIGLAEVAQDGLLPAGSRVGEVDHQLQFRAIAPLFFPQLGRVEFQLGAAHLRLEQARSADAPARNVETIDVALAIEDMERRAEHHVVPFGAQARRHFLDRNLQLVFVVRLAPQHLVGLHDEFERRIAPFDKKFLHARIGVIEKQVAGRCFAIAPGAARLLVVGLHAPRHIEMHDETDVRPIDPHPKCVRRHHDVAPPLHELVLRLLALLVAHPAVVKNARDLRRS